jgi:hypothetical protein
MLTGTVFLIKVGFPDAVDAMLGVIACTLAVARRVDTPDVVEQQRRTSP